MTTAKGTHATTPTPMPTLRLSANDPLLTVVEAAQLLRVSKMTVYRLINHGEIPALRVGRSFRIPKSDLQAYVTQAATPGKKEE